MSTRTASEAEMYRTFDDDDAGDDDPSHVHAASQLNKSLSETKLLNGHDALDSNNNYPGVQSILNNTRECLVPLWRSERLTRALFRCRCFPAIVQQSKVRRSPEIKASQTETSIDPNN